MSQPPAQQLRKFRFNFPQRVAALLLLLFLLQGLWLIVRTPLTVRDFHYAVYGSRMWAAFSAPALPPATGHSLNDGVLAYRAAGLPVALDNWLAGRAADTLGPNPHLQIARLAFWLRLPFLLAGLALGGCLWWVTRRLFGNPGGYVSLGLYCFAPLVLARSVVPNNGILAAFGLFAAMYTAIGVAHAMQGPRCKWRKRIILLSVTLGFTAAASPLAFLLVLVLGTTLLTWLAEDRRKHVPRLTLLWTSGALLIFFAASGFQPSAFSAFLHFAPLGHQPLSHLIQNWHLLPLLAALAVALALYAAIRRSRYFGNTTPLWIAALLILFAALDASTSCCLWAVPFLLTFMGGIYADAFETRFRKTFLAFALLIILAQAALSVTTLSVGRNSFGTSFPSRNIPSG